MGGVRSSEFRVQNLGFRVQSLGFRVQSLKKSVKVVCFFFALFIVSQLAAVAQEKAYFYRVNPYNFIRYDLNEMHFPGKRTSIDCFYSKLEKQLTSGEGRINIVHIGGSHIQAGTFSGQMRNRFQTLNGEMNAGWGYMFPYRISRTNSPFGYYIRHTGSWQSFRNVESRKSGTLGVGGMSATTNSTKAELTILLEKENTLDYRFNQFRVYYENKGKNYELSVDPAILDTVSAGDGYLDFALNTYVDSLTLSLTRKSGSTRSFTLFGITTESAPNGIMYHSIGVNGAHVPAYLRCQLFETQLAELKPDLVILGIGINDAYGRRFSQDRFEDHYDQLIDEIKRAAPDAAIVFTTNNDSYLYRRYVNKNGEKVRESMFRMAAKYNAGVWDMFSVMGGLNSIVLWQKNQLAQSDKIHFTREGYLLIGDLFFNAIMQDFEHYLGARKEVYVDRLRAGKTETTDN
ncbi:MAG: GDSL-type esterase/lipase family protein [Draconibacterium sp.]